MPTPPSFKPFDIVDHLDSLEAIAGYLTAILEEGKNDPAVLRNAMATAVRALEILAKPEKHDPRKAERFHAD